MPRPMPTYVTFLVHWVALGRSVSIPAASCTASCTSVLLGNIPQSLAGNLLTSAEYYELCLFQGIKMDRVQPHRRKHIEKSSGIAQFCGHGREEWSRIKQGVFTYSKHELVRNFMEFLEFLPDQLFIASLCLFTHFAHARVSKP